MCYAFACLCQHKDDIPSLDKVFLPMGAVGGAFEHDCYGCASLRQ